MNKLLVILLLMDNLLFVVNVMVLIIKLLSIKRFNYLINIIKEDNHLLDLKE